MSSNTIAKFADVVRNPDPGAGAVDACSTLGVLRVDQAGALRRYTGDPVEPYQLLVAPYPAAIGLVLSASVLTVAGVSPLAASIIQLYDASTLVDGDMILRLPAAPTLPLGIKNTSSSVVEVIVDGNGQLVEGPGAAPAATASISLARVCCVFHYHSATGTWWIT